MLDDEAANRGMIVVQQRNHVFGVGTLREACKSPQVTEQCGNFASMAFQLLFIARCNYQIGDLWRKEPTEFAHPLDFTDLLGNTPFKLLIELGDLRRTLTQFLQ